MGTNADDKPKLLSSWDPVPCDSEKGLSEKVQRGLQLERIESSAVPGESADTDGEQKLRVLTTKTTLVTSAHALMGTT